MTHAAQLDQPSQLPLAARPQAPQRAPRSDAGRVRLTARDIAGLSVVAQMYAAPYDLLGERLGVTQPRLRAILARWRRAGLADTAVITAGPPWCWATQRGLRHLGYPWTYTAPALSRLAHTRAALACRMMIEAGDAYRARGAQWRPERAIRSAIPAVAPCHIPDAEIIWPASGDGGPGESWAIEVELTPKTLTRTTRIMAGLLSQPYARVVYLCSGPALPVVTRAAAAFRPGQAEGLAVRPIPPAAYL
jgi:hypothetical protein